MSDASTATPYRVLARKYRPSDFAALIGQEAMVRTLSNAIQAGRLAHAFVLTGVRGVGKTTTARIIARALNCVGPDGTGGPTIEPCGVCDHCRSIAEDRHVDIMEMDAASRTGIGDIRELIEGVRYRPTSARYKIYIIDEVHMLSTAAFNGLLKTLEEPPEHVKFIFATTEIRKIPITVLSRCQRFDLKRVEMDVLSAHFARIVQKENATIEDGALALIARAADGSVRDGLSLLDQAISHGNGQVSELQVRDMLGLADRARVFDLFEAVMAGHMAQALDMMAEQYALGADPAVVLQDMLELAHWLTRLKVTPDMAKASGTASETERVKGGEMAAKLGMAHLTRAWQMLLKGLQETRSAPNPLQAAEMTLVRLAYAADLPTPAELLDKWGGNPPPHPGGGGARSGAGGATGSATVAAVAGSVGPGSSGNGSSGNGPSAFGSMAPHGGGGATALQLAHAPQPVALPPMPATFVEVVALFSEKRENILAVALRTQVGLVRFEPGRIELRPFASAPHDLAQKVGRLLGEWTGRRWAVAVNTTDPAQSSLADQDIAAEKKRREDAANHPLVHAIMTTFPGASIELVRDIAPPADSDAEEDGLAFDSDLSAGDDEL